ncbi:hypothetical protein VT84_12580 [Gemmata sp. SH-PL17]|uniref:effector-associated domain EAD1-containing protein n=1 Tax=Gemmata sp. SH-PL17 TaxID=1630693 RepID=UPI00078E958C|nr:effector-associated domain EAD1-containing protein [Gemmata sp. SH-PL17]AMV25227.1 hypothetical protein VT84_12580 [Gemmata sp. SH-PL17]
MNTLTGFDLERVRDLLADTFDGHSFDEMLLFDLNITRSRVVPDGAFNTVVLNVLLLSTREGWVPRLIAAAAKRRPGRPDVQELAKQYAATLVAQIKDPQLAGNPQLRQAYRDLNPDKAWFPAEQELKGFEKTIDPENPYLNMAEWVARLARIEGRVCRVEIGGAPRGTGFLVGPDAVLTNHHVVASAIGNAAVLAQLQFRFDYKQLANGTILSGMLVGAAAVLESTPCTPGERTGHPEAADPDTEHLDYALVRLVSPIGDQPIAVPGAVAVGPRRGWVRLPECLSPEGDPFAPGGAVLIAQHPAGEPLRLAIGWQSVIEANGTLTRVKHRTNTSGGSSGSPCFDRFLNPIALHHYGDPMYPEARFNQGVPLMTVRARLAQVHAAMLSGACD